MSRWHTRSRLPTPFGKLLQVGLMPSARAVLHERIALRFDAMLAAGLVDEVRGRARHAPTAGYRRCVAWATGRSGSFWNRRHSADLRDKGIAATRQLASGK